MHAALKTAFTLIEMLVVIAIISILASLLMPSLDNAIKMGRSAVCSNNQRQRGIELTSGIIRNTLKLKMRC